jgi:sugar O-acyltransferase (sialic acid O-acetyltransferase NeuD family)
MLGEHMWSVGASLGASIRMTAMKEHRLVVLGAGGHARVVIAALQAAAVTVDGALDDCLGLHGGLVQGVPVLGPISLVATLGASATIAIGGNRNRQRLASSYLHIEWVSVVHPWSWLADPCAVGAGTVVCAGCVVQPGAVIGQHAIINTGASVDHDSVVGDFAHLAPGVRLAGHVTVGEGALLGIGSVVAPGCTIGAWAS